MMRTHILATLTVLAFTAWHSGPAVGYSVIGPGVSSCATWADDGKRNEPAAQHNLVWVLGYLAGVAYGSPDDDDPLRGVDAMTIRAWIDSYCSGHPLATIEDAAVAFYAFHPR